MKVKRIIFFLGMLWPVLIYSQSISQYQFRLNQNWIFLKGDIGGIWESARISQKGQPTDVPIWDSITLPHCFNRYDAVDPDVNYYQGPGWYKNLVSFDNPYPNGRTLLLFEGAGQKTELFIGLEKVTAHTGGYDEWLVDITDFIEKANEEKYLHNTYKGKTLVSVRCDNSRDLQMIPSDLSDFNVYGGLYRYVNLIYVPENWVRGMKISPVVQEKSKNGEVCVELLPSAKFTSPVEITLSVIAPDGTRVYSGNIAESEGSYKKTIKIKKPELWSPENPQLYSVTVSVVSSRGQQQLNDKFGFRWYNFEKNGPFYLNGKRLLIKGTHRHEDHAGVGAAMSEEQIRQEMLMIKKMGANFIRLGHYQQSRIVLNLCDSLGILVWEEIPWCRGGLGGEKYKEQARSMLTNMINQHYNHPSVIIWGLGNENDWPGDTKEFDEQVIRGFMSELNRLAHQLDSSRKTAIRRCDFCKDIVDVYSPSIWAGWYRGKYTEYFTASQEHLEQVDHFLHMEWGASSHAGRHSENPDAGMEKIKTGMGTDERNGDASLYGGIFRASKDGDWTETYACNLFDWTLKEQEKMPWLTGTAFWIFKDFSTPIRPDNPVPYMNQKGVVERDLTPKESYYLFQSYWATEPMLHIYGHTWQTRWGDAQQERFIKVYSNCPKVELFLNGKSLGTKKRNSQDFPAAGLRWSVIFKEGTNTVKAIGTSGKTIITDSVEINYQTTPWKAPVKLLLSEKNINKEYSWLEVEALDENNTLSLDAKNQVVFSVSGEANLVDNLGTVTGSRKVQLTNGMARIKIKKHGGTYSAAVTSEGLHSSMICAKDYTLIDQQDGN